MNTALYAAEIADLQAQLADLRCWMPTARRDALIAMREERIEELTACMELGAEIAESAADADAEAVEVSAALEAAIVTAQATGHAIIKGAPALVNELVRLVPGCVEVRNGMEYTTVYTEGGEVRMVRRAGSYRAAMIWRVA
jgi:hypothetical protein